MGLAASQARLLTITARLADNELRSQTINNAKMRLATQTSQASDEYVTALNNAQMMFSNVGTDGIAKNQALTFNALTSFSQYNNQYGIKNSAGMLLVSEKDAANFKNHSNDLNGFLGEYGLKWDTTFFDVKNGDEYDLSKKLVDFYSNTDDYGLIQEFFAGKTNEDLKKMYEASLSQSSSIERLNYDAYASAYYNEYNTAFKAAQDKLTTQMGTRPINEDGTKPSFTVTSLDDLKMNLLGYQGINTGCYLQYNTNDGTIIQSLNGTRTVLSASNNPQQYSLNKISDLLNDKGKSAVIEYFEGILETYRLVESGTPYYYGLPATNFNEGEDKVAKTVSSETDEGFCFDDLVAVYKDGEYVIHFNQDETENKGVGTVSTSFAIVDGVETKTVTETKVTGKNDDGSDITETFTTTYKLYNNDFSNSNYDLDLASLVASGEWSNTILLGEQTSLSTYNYSLGNNGSRQFYIERIDSDGTTNKYLYNVEGNEYRKVNLYDTTDENQCNEFYAALINQYFDIILSNPDYLNVVDNINKETIDHFKEYSNGDNLIDAMKSNKSYFLDLNLLLKERGTAIYTGWQEDNGTRYAKLGDTKFDTVVDTYIVDYMLDVFGEPKFAWVDVNDTTNSGNADAKAQWYTNLFERMQKGYKVLENGLANSREWMEYAFETGLVTMEQVDKSFNWISLDYKSCANIFEDSDNSSLVAKAEAKYNRAMNDIKQKDNMYDLQLKNIDTEHSALQTEYESVKSVMKKNIERTMKFDQSG